MAGHFSGSAGVAGVQAEVKQAAIKTADTSSQSPLPTGWMDPYKKRPFLKKLGSMF